jgi:hypothetical protein
MQLDSLAQFYVSKTDDELLALAADLDSLTHEARPVLADELRRRNLTLQPSPATVEHQTPPSPSRPVGEIFRTAGAFVAHLVAALLGTGMVESSFAPTVRALVGQARSFVGIETRIWLMSLTIAALLGFLISRYRPSKSALWVWTLPGAFLAFRVLLYGLGKPASVAEHFLAPNCLDSKSECQDFLVFTVSAARTVAYSLGAWVSMRFQKHPTRTDVVVV